MFESSLYFSGLEPTRKASAGIYLLVTNKYIASESYLVGLNPEKYNEDSNNFFTLPFSSLDILAIGAIAIFLGIDCGGGWCCALFLVSTKIECHMEWISALNFIR